MGGVNFKEYLRSTLTLPYLCRKLFFIFPGLSCLLELIVLYENTTKEEAADSYNLDPKTWDLKIPPFF